MVLWLNIENLASGLVVALSSNHNGAQLHLEVPVLVITGSHHNPHDFRDYYSLVHQFPIKIFLLNSQKRRQMRQSNHPPLFTRRRSAGYWAILTNTNHYIPEIWLNTVRGCTWLNTVQGWGLICLIHLQQTFLLLSICIGLFCLLTFANGFSAYMYCHILWQAQLCCLFDCCVYCLRCSKLLWDKLTIL